MPKKIWRVIFRDTDIFDMRLGEQGWGSVIKAFHWEKDDLIGPKMVVDLESPDVQVVIPLRSVYTYLVKELP